MAEQEEQQRLRADFMLPAAQCPDDQRLVMERESRRDGEHEEGAQDRPVQPDVVIGVGPARDDRDDLGISIGLGLRDGVGDELVVRLAHGKAFAHLPAASRATATEAAAAAEKPPPPPPPPPQPPPPQPPTAIIATAAAQGRAQCFARGPHDDGRNAATTAAIAPAAAARCSADGRKQDEGENDQNDGDCLEDIAGIDFGFWTGSRFGGQLALLIGRQLEDLNDRIHAGIDAAAMSPALKRGTMVLR